MPQVETRNEKLDLRLTPSAKRTLQAAAKIARRSVSDFVLESALARAEEITPDETRIVLGPAEWEAFVAALDAPPKYHPETARLLRDPSIFEQEGLD